MSISTVIKRTLILIVITLSLFGISFFVLLEKQMQQPLSFEQDQLLTIHQGSSVASFAKQLVSKGWIKNRFWLRAYARINPDLVNIKAGTYQFTTGLSLQEMLRLLNSGKEHQFQITFVEGSTFKQWLSQINKEAQLSKVLINLSNEDIAQKIGIEQGNPEGWFYPETYAFTKGTTDLQLLSRAFNKMNKSLAELWENRASNLPYESPYSALIMASIIEKETSHIPEQPLISSVFINRLKKRMRLQTDPTVIYGLGDRYKGDITRAHLREKTAYNTYRINGLPPTPIAMPSYSAIKATLNPATSDYYYFVSNGEGKHVFSKTLNEHNKAVRDYLASQKNK